MSKSEVRCVKSVRSQVTVGELYRWILAKLSDKDIKRALHKYRDLMPRQSDWNRKLTQATNIPELGFRYLYRCGQIDESNHRTMQKMLKYIDRQDVLPYFDSILYNTNNSNASIEQLRNCLLDKVKHFISLCELDEFNQVFIGSPYIIRQCQPVTNLRLTRSVRKRLSTGDYNSCLSYIKCPRLDSPEAKAVTEEVDVQKKVNSVVNGNSVSDFKLVKDMNSEHFASRVLNCLKQSRQRYRNITLLNSYSLPGVVEAPIQLLLHSNNSNSTNTNNIVGTPGTKAHTSSQSTAPNNDPEEQLETDDKVFDNLKDVYSKQKDLAPGFFYAKIRIRIRMDSGNYLEEMDSLQSTRTETLDRQMDIIAQTSSFLRDREAGEMICELRCTELDQVDCLWRDYQTGMLKKRLSEILLVSPEQPNIRHLNDRFSYMSSMVMSNLKLHIFISRQEYESCRAILMRNLYPVYVYRQPSPQSIKYATAGIGGMGGVTGNSGNNNNNGHGNGASINSATVLQAPPSATHSDLHWNQRNVPAGSNIDVVSNRQNTTSYATSSGGPQRFPAVQHLIAHLREVPQMNMWSIGQPQISVAHRPVLMHMFYPQESYIPVTVNPLLRPINLMSPLNGINNQSPTSRTSQ